jgi:hypothetical protein
LFTIYKHSPCAKNSRMMVKKDENGELYIGERDAVDENSVPSDSNPNGTYIENTTKYSVPLYSPSDGTIIGWTALLPDPINKQYLVATLTDIDNKQEEAAIRWMVRGVERPGSYTFDAFEHKDTDPSIWWRDKKVGIDDQGRFYTNALKNSATALSIDAIGAFTFSAEDEAYVGAEFEVGKDNDNSVVLMKMFCATENMENKEGTLFISGATDTDNEYQRPIKMFGQRISLFANSKSSEDRDWLSKPESNHKLVVDANNIAIGHEVIALNSEDKSKEDFTKSKRALLELTKEGSVETSRLRVSEGFKLQIGDSSQQEKFLTVGADGLPPCKLFYSIEKEKTAANSYDLNTSVIGGSIETKIMGNNSEQGNLLSYATGDFEFNRTDGTYRKEETEEILNISKALQLKKDSLLFGDKDNFKGLQLEIDEKQEDGTASRVSNPWFGDPAEWLMSHSLCSNIKGTRFESNEKYSLLATDKRFGIYSQNGLDIQELGGAGLRLNSRSEEDESESYLQLTPSVDTGASLTLSSKHGIISIKSNARGEVSGSQNGIELNPGLSTGFGIFSEGITGEMGAIDLTTHPAGQYLSNTSILANGHITTAEGDLWAPRGTCWAENFIFNEDGVAVAKKSPGVHISGSNLDKDKVYYSYNSVWSHIEQLYTLVSGAMYRANSAYSYAGSAHTAISNLDIPKASDFASADHIHVFSSMVAVRAGLDVPYADSNGKLVGFDWITQTNGPRNP